MGIFVSLRTKLLKKEIYLEELTNYTDQMKAFIDALPKKEYEMNELEALIYLTLDYYTFSQTGEELILDPDYFRLVQEWMMLHDNQEKYAIIYPDPIAKQWDFVKHEEPGMVGSIKKVYNVKELKGWLEPWRGYMLKLAPKYDGCSNCIKVKNGEIVSALTRYDGINGQNVTRIAQNASNAKTFLREFWGKKEEPKDGYYKCEIVVTTQNFELLRKEREYANRRSATSGIMNSPSNVKYAKYVTIVPLLYYSGKGTKQEFVYRPPICVESHAQEVVGLYEAIEKLLEKIKQSDFPIRTDGVVIVPGKAFFNYKLNEFDYMEQCIAYKLNQEFAYTPIEYGYMSIGKTGIATPMLHVKKVEVNETEVSDVSLSSYDKYQRMDFHEGEVVRVFSAGDVIPQAEPAEHREWPAGAGKLKIEKECSYCGSRLEAIGREYYCTNPNCIRVNTGRILDFIDKMGCMGIADATIEDLYRADLIHNVLDLFNLPELQSEIANLPGYGKRKAEIIVNEINGIVTREVPISKLLGALGIRGIGEKKCQRMLEYVTVDYLMNKSKEKIAHRVLDADGIGVPTAELFANFIVKNREFIRSLLEIIQISPEVNYKYNVVFTGFRDPGLAKRFNAIGFGVAGSVTNKTMAVIANNTNHDDSHMSGSYAKAFTRGITIIDRKDVDQLLEQLDDRYQI